MSDSDRTQKYIQRRFRDLSEEADAGDSKEANHEYLLQRCRGIMDELIGLVATLKVQRDHENELALRDGVVGKWGSGQHVDFKWRCPRTGQERSAEVYPNARNEGKTFGLKTWDGPRHAGNSDKFHGAHWDYEDAFAAGKAWVNDGEAPIHPMDAVKAIMER